MKRFKFYTDGLSIQKQMFSLFRVSSEIIQEEEFKHYTVIQFRITYVSTHLFDFFSKYSAKGYAISVLPINSIFQKIVICTTYC